MNSILSEMWHAWAAGGPVMAAMFLLAIFMYAIAVQLLLRVRIKDILRATDPVLRSWVVQPTAAPERVRELIRYTQDDIHSVRDIEGRFREVEAAEITEIDRRVTFLNVLVISAPLFGLLGTVMGMLLTFKAIGIGGSSTSEVISRGISEALVATQTGMMVAIPGLIMATIAKRRRHEFVAFLARLEGITLRHFRPEFHGMTRIFTRAEVAERSTATTVTPVAQPVAS